MGHLHNKNHFVQHIVYIIVENQITFAEAMPAGTDFFAVVLSTTSTTFHLTSLTVGRRSGAYTIDMHGEGFGVVSRDGTKTPVYFNAA